MGKISNVMYEVVNPAIYDAYEMNKFYWYHNLLGLNDDIDNEYVEYQSHQINVRNNVVKKMQDDNSNIKLRLNNSIFGTSSRSKNVVMIAEY